LVSAGKPGRLPRTDWFVLDNKRREARGADKDQATALKAAQRKRTVYY
jgi:hypothetical protein